MTSVKVELQAVPEGETEYRVVAELVVHADGAYELNDPDEYLSLEISVPVASDSEGFRSLTFEDDRQAWARNLPNALRTGYLVPVVSDVPDGSDIA